MPDGTDNENSGSDLIPVPPTEQEYPVDRLKARVSGVFAGRPLAVYLVLFAGAATLIILLIIVWISATGTSNDERPICTHIATLDARDAVLNGQVDRIDVLVDADSPANTLTGINLEFTDGSCRSTVQGADARNDLYLVLGAVDFYNNFAENRVRIHIQKQSIQPELLSTATPIPTATVPPTETPTPTATSEPTLTPTATATHTPTVEPTKRPEASATAPASAPSQTTPKTNESILGTSMPRPEPTRTPEPSKTAGP